MPDPIVTLASTLTPAIALKVASILEIDGSLDRAISKLPTGSSAVEPLRDCHATLGPSLLVSLLRGFARSANSSRREVRAVWSGPTFDGDGDHTTSALSHLIDDAVEDVFASTYSATADSIFVNALWRAIARGVKTTLLVDSTVNDGKTAAMLAQKLSGARFWTFCPPSGGYGRQHSKVVIIDSRVVFVTSANLSDAGAEKNLEAGLVAHDPDLASKMRQRFQSLYSEGALADL